jgi:hypothetical protein
MEHLKNLISWGNIKVPHPIFNMCSAKKCPARARGMCSLAEICYGDKAERIYPQVIPYRDRQQEYWNGCESDQFVNEFSTAKGRRDPEAMRFNEVGDITYESEIDKLDDIARGLSEKCGVTVYTYTARRDMIDKLKSTENVVINGSGFMVHNWFMITNDVDAMIQRINGMPNQPKAVRCIADCNKCNLCTKKNGYIIVAKKH